MLRVAIHTFSTVPAAFATAGTLSRWVVVRTNRFARCGASGAPHPRNPATHFF